MPEYTNNTCNNIFLDFISVIKRCTYITALLLLLSAPAHATDWEELCETYAEMKGENGYDEDMINTLEYLHENPVPLNNSSKETLNEIPFLDKRQIESLYYYIQRYGPLNDISELLLVKNLDPQIIRLISPFVCIGTSVKRKQRIQAKKIFKYGKYDFSTISSACMQQKKGYKENKYAGSPYKIGIKLGFNNKNKLKYGILTEKDAGEKIFFYSAHLMINDYKKIEAFIIGDYKINMGYGLICGNSFSLGKSNYILTTSYSQKNIRRHFSYSEGNFFRGSSITIKLMDNDKIQTKLTALLSSKKIDALTENNIIRTIYKTGLYRTSSEKDKRNKARETTCGGNINFSFKNSSFSISYIYLHFNKIYSPKARPYNKYYFRGKTQSNIEFDIKKIFKKSLIYSAIAVDKKNKTAFISGINTKIKSTMSWNISYRNYDKKYNAYFANGLAERSITNEEGIFSNIEWRFYRKFRLNAYYDIFRFPWLIYRVDAPSHGKEYKIKITYTPDTKTELSLSYRIKDKAEKYTGKDYPHKKITNKKKHTATFKLKRNLNKTTLKTAAEINKKNSNYGYALQQSIKYKSTLFGISETTSYFKTQTYDNRIYMYEYSLPGKFSIPCLYGNGIRTSIIIKLNIKNLTAAVNLTETHRFDTKTIGSGLEEVEENNLTYLNFFVRLKL